MSGNTSVYGVFRNRSHAEGAIDRIRMEGFRAEDISFLAPETLGTRDMAIEGNSKVPEGAAAGGTIGAVTGGVMGWLVGIGALAIPGIGPFIAAGPIMAALAGLGAGATIGGLSGALVGAGLPEYEAKRYEGQVREGGVLLSIHCDDSEWSTRAKEVLTASGADDIASSGEASMDRNVRDAPLSRAAAK